LAITNSSKYLSIVGSLSIFRDRRVLGRRDRRPRPNYLSLALRRIKIIFLRISRNALIDATIEVLFSIT